MKKSNYSAKGLLNKKRFERFNQQETLALRRTSVKKGIIILEGLLDSGIIEEFKKARKQLKFQ